LIKLLRVFVDEIDNHDRSERGGYAVDAHLEASLQTAGENSILGA
jgi:hypothetical protein